MGMRPVRAARITNPFAAPGAYASRADKHGPAGHHTGIDFGAPVIGGSLAGKTVRSCTHGMVVISEYQKNSDGSSTMGNWVGVYFRKDDVLITYWHMAERKVNVGDYVIPGTPIGKVGTTGNSTAPHLHVQANRGSTFNYSGHIAPGRWCRGDAWWRRFARRVRR